MCALVLPMSFGVLEPGLSKKMGVLEPASHSFFFVIAFFVHQLTPLQHSYAQGGWGTVPVSFKHPCASVGVALVYYLGS
jgi:hypothetical protein